MYAVAIKLIARATHRKSFCRVYYKEENKKILKRIFKVKKENKKHLPYLTGGHNLI